MLEGGQQRVLPPLLRLNGEILRLRGPLTGELLRGEWGPNAQPVSVRIVPRADEPTLPRLLHRMQSCHHGAVPRVVGVERWEDCWCALFEPLQGTTLAMRLATGKPPSQRWRFRLVWQLAYAVLTAHSHGLASGSLTESGVWLTSESYLKLPDWSERADPATDRQDLVGLGQRLNVDLSDNFPDWLPGFERKARRRSVYEPL